MPALCWHPRACGRCSLRATPDLRGRIPLPSAGGPSPTRESVGRFGNRRSVFGRPPRRRRAANCRRCRQPTVNITLPLRSIELPTRAPLSSGADAVSPLEDRPPRQPNPSRSGLRIEATASGASAAPAPPAAVPRWPRRPPRRGSATRPGRRTPGPRAPARSASALRSRLPPVRRPSAPDASTAPPPPRARTTPPAASTPRRRSADWACPLRGRAPKRSRRRRSRSRSGVGRRRGARQRPEAERVDRQGPGHVVLRVVDGVVRGAVDDHAGTRIGHRRAHAGSIGDVEIRAGRPGDVAAVRQRPAELPARAGDQRPHRERSSTIAQVLAIELPRLIVSRSRSTASCAYRAPRAGARQLQLLNQANESGECPQGQYDPPSDAGFKCADARVERSNLSLDLRLERVEVGFRYGFSDRVAEHVHQRFGFAARSDRHPSASEWRHGCRT